MVLDPSIGGTAMKIELSRVAAANRNVRATGTPVVIAGMVQTSSTTALAIGAINSEARRGGLGGDQRWERCEGKTQCSADQ